jgi:hypothetical protein
MAYLEEILPEFRAGAKIRRKDWPENLSISLKGCCGLNVAFYDVDADDWEIYQEPINWNYIIENRCPCWFWDAERKVLGILVNCNKDDMYLRDGDCYYRNCRPVRKDEVTFYEDKKDE